MQKNVSDINTDNSIRIPYYVHIIPYGYLTSGQKITSSGIKPSSYSDVSLPYSIENLTGYVFNEYNDTSKDLNLKAFVKWNPTQISQDCNFHILVEESGRNSTKYDYFLQIDQLIK